MYNEGKTFCRAHSKYQIECFRSLNNTREAVLRSTLADGPQYGGGLLLDGALAWTVRWTVRWNVLGGLATTATTMWSSDFEIIESNISLRFN